MSNKQSLRCIGNESMGVSNFAVLTNKRFLSSNSYIVCIKDFNICIRSVKIKVLIG